MRGNINAKLHGSTFLKSFPAAVQAFYKPAPEEYERLLKIKRALLKLGAPPKYKEIIKGNSKEFLLAYPEEDSDFIAWYNFNQATIDAFTNKKNPVELKKIIGGKKSRKNRNRRTARRRSNTRRN